MRNKRKTGIAFVVIGVVLLLAALLLHLHNQLENVRAEQSAQMALAAVQEAIGARITAPVPVVVPEPASAEEVPTGSTQTGNIQPENIPTKDFQPQKDSTQNVQGAETQPESPPAGETHPEKSLSVESQPEQTETVPELPTVFINGHEYVGYLEIPSLNRTLPVMRLVYVEDLQTAPCLQVGSPLTDDAVIAAHNYASHFGPLRDMTGGESILFTDMEGNTISYVVEEVRTVQPNLLDMYDTEYDLVLYTCTTGGATRVVIGCNRAE